MNSKKKRSSRSRMENRSKKRSRPSAVFLKSLDGKSEVAANRAARNQSVYYILHAQGLSIAQAQRQKRKEKLVQARRELRKMRKETKRAMRAAAGGL